MGIIMSGYYIKCSHVK